MTDVLLESVRAIVLFGIVVFLLGTGIGKTEHARRGWRWIFSGFCLLLLGAIVDITDNYDSLNPYVIIGDTPAQAFLEKFVGFLGGFICLAVGLVVWIPQVKRQSEEIELRIKAEENYLKTNTKLKQVLADVSSSRENVEKTLESAVVRNEMQTHYASMATHQIQTTLAIINATANKVKNLSNDSKLLPEDAVRNMEETSVAVRHMVRLMKNTLTAAQRRDGKINIEIEDCNVATIVRQVCDRAQQETPDYTITPAILDIPETIPADIGAVEQILTDMIYIAIEMAHDRNFIDVEVHAVADQIVVTVVDNGNHPSEEEAAIAQAHSAVRTRPSNNTDPALGLRMASVLAELHDGLLNVVNGEDQGHCYTLYLPIAGPDLGKRDNTPLTNETTDALTAIA